MWGRVAWGWQKEIAWDRTRSRLVVREHDLGSVSLGPNWHFLRAHFFPLSLYAFFHQISMKSREGSTSIFLQLFVPFGPRFLSNMTAKVILPLVRINDLTYLSSYVLSPCIYIRRRFGFFFYSSILVCIQSSFSVQVHSFQFECSPL